MKIVVFTASIGERRGLYTPSRVNRSVEYLAFVDRRIDHKVWKTIRVDRDPDVDPVRQAKKFKVLADEFVEADASIWVDRHCRLMCDPVEAFDEFVEDVGVVRHYRRGIFKEGRACREKKKDDPELIRRTVDRFRLEGWKPGAGLFYGGFLMRRHSPDVGRFNRLWLNYIESGSARDQLSLPVAIERSGVSAKFFSRRRRGDFFKIRGK